MTDTLPFTGLKLQRLSLYQNQLTFLPAESFKGMVTLRYLDLGGNQLTSLAPDVFADLVNLEELTLNDNQLSSLPPGDGSVDTLPCRACIYACVCLSLCVAV